MKVWACAAGPIVVLVHTDVGESADLTCLNYSMKFSITLERKINTLLLTNLRSAKLICDSVQILSLSIFYESSEFLLVKTLFRNENSFVYLVKFVCYALCRWS